VLIGWINKKPTFDKIKGVLYLLKIEGFVGLLRGCFGLKKL
jgi:hypothetical protein